MSAEDLGRQNVLASRDAVQCPPVIRAHEDAPVPGQRSVSPAAPSALCRLFLAPIKFLWGMLFCQSAMGGLAVLGWSYRFMQRSALKKWWKLSDCARSGGSFTEFVAADSRTRSHIRWPNWFLAQNFGEIIRRDPDLGLRKHFRDVLASLGVSLWTNIGLGVQGICNTWFFTLPGCLLMWFGWYDGWNNSFNKGYEQAPVGPLISVAGILLFITAMLYVPMAQARQAVTGEWRQFYQFRLIWTLVRRRWFASIGLAALYSLFTLPVMVLTILPIFFPQMNASLSELTQKQTIGILNRYYFWAALLFLPAFVLLRWVAARIYATALLKSVQSGATDEEKLSELEWQTLHRLDLLRVQPVSRKHPAIEIASRAGTKVGWMAARFLTGLVWFTMLAQIAYVAQFFRYTAFSWLNVPLVQLPWFHYVPLRLKNPFGELFLTAVIIFVAWRVRRLAAWVKSLSRHGETGSETAPQQARETGTR
jgi:hypothetical protein